MLPSEGSVLSFDAFAELKLPGRPWSLDALETFLLLYISSMTFLCCLHIFTNTRHFQLKSSPLKLLLNAL